MNIRISGNYTRNGVTERARWERWQPAGCWEETERKKRNAASQQFLLKIYSVQLHEKYRTPRLSSFRVTPRRLPRLFHFLPFFFLPFLSFSSVSYFDPPSPRSIFALYILSFSLLCARTCLWRSAREPAIHFSALRCHPALGTLNNFAFAIMHRGRYHN